MTWNIKESSWLVHHYVASKEGRLEVRSFDFSVHYSFLLYGVSYLTSFFIRWISLDLCYNLNVKSSPGFWSLGDGTIWGSCKSVVGRTLLEIGTDWGFIAWSHFLFGIWFLSMDITWPSYLLLLPLPPCHHVFLSGCQVLPTIIDYITLKF